MIRLWRPWYWLPALAAGFAAALFGANGELTWQTGVLLFIILGPGICGFAETVNDIWDRRSDSRGTQKALFGIPLSGGTGVMSAHPTKAKRRLAIATAATSVALACVASLLISTICFVLCVTGIVLAWMYSAPPVTGQHRSVLGTLLLFAGYGPVAIWLGLSIASHSMDLTLFGFSFLVGIWTASIGMTADLLDYDDDKRNGCKTFVVTFGRSATTGIIMGASTAIVVGAFLIRLLSGSGIGIGFCVFVAVHAVFLACLFGFRNKQMPAAVHGVTIILETAYPFVLFGGIR